MSRRNTALRLPCSQQTFHSEGIINPKSHYGFCKPLMTGPEGNSQFCFPRISMFPEAKPRKTSRFVICYIAGNLLNLAVTAVVGQHSRATEHCYPLTSYILQCCSLRDFGVKQFHCQMSCDLEVTNESRPAVKKKFPAT